MTHRQQENLAKYLYDLSKILFATVVVGNLVAPSGFDVVVLSVGVSGAGACYAVAFVLDGVKF